MVLGLGLGRGFGRNLYFVFVKRRSRLANWDVGMVVGLGIQAEGQVDGQMGEDGGGCGIRMRVIEMGVYTQG
jgi:hypothetical protein